MNYPAASYMVSTSPLFASLTLGTFPPEEEGIAGTSTQQPFPAPGWGKDVPNGTGRGLSVHRKYSIILSTPEQSYEAGQLLCDSK